MKGVKELRISNYWAHFYESVVFGVDGEVVDGVSIDRKDNHSNTIFTEHNADLYIDMILDGNLLTKDNYTRLEQRYTPHPKPSKNYRKSGLFNGQLYLSFNHELKGVSIVVNFSKEPTFESNIWFIIGDEKYRFALKDYTLEMHRYCLGMLSNELSLA